MVLLGLTDSLITFGKKDALIIKETHRQGGLIGLAHWFDGRNNSLDHYVNLGVDGFEIANQNQIAYPMETHEKIVKMCADNQLFIIGGADYHGYGPACNTWNAMEISNWEQLTHVQKTHGIMDGLIYGNNRVLFYSLESWALGIKYRRQRTGIIYRNRIFITLLYGTISWFY